MRGYVRASPATSLFLVVLVVTDIAFYHLMSGADATRRLEAISTNLDNLHTRPVAVLFASALVPAGGIVTLDGLVFVVGCLGGCLALVERRVGTLRAVAVFLTAHIGATLLTACVITAAVHTGRYPEDVREALDYGVSYGAVSAAAAVTWLLPARPLRIAWATCGIAYPLIGATWFGWLPDFTSIGHVLSVLIGLCLGFVFFRPIRSPEPHSPPAR